MEEDSTKSTFIWSQWNKIMISQIFAAITGMESKIQREEHMEQDMNHSRTIHNLFIKFGKSLGYSLQLMEPM